MNAPVVVSGGGGAVDIDGAYAVAFERDTARVNIYKDGATGWSGTPVFSIEKPVDASSQYGRSKKTVAYDDATGLLAVGDIQAGVERTGAVYLFDRIHGTESFVLVQKIIPEGQVSNGLFGSSVDMENGQLIVGGLRLNTASIYRLSAVSGTMELEATLETNDVVADVAVSAGIFALGHGRATVNAQPSAGRVDIYLQDGTSIAQFMQPTAPVPLPASAVLLIAGLAGLGAMRRAARRV